MGLSINAMRSGMYWADEPADVPVAVRATTWDMAQQAYVRLVPTPKHIEMLFYVMKHYPGNTNNSWTRQFFGDLSHGITRFDMFLFNPSMRTFNCSTQIREHVAA